MFNIEKWLYQVITTDTILQDILRNTAAVPVTPYNIYPMGVDIQPENMPAITYIDAGTAMLSIPQGMRVGRLQLDVWSIMNMAEVMTVYTRLGQLINYQHTRTTPTPIDGILWWIREDATRDQPETSRRMWRKTITYKFWTNNPDNL